MGGSPCAGKSTVAHALAAQHGCDVYSCDAHFSKHAALVDASRHPIVSNFRTLHPDEVWLRPVTQLLRDALAFYEDTFAFILEDLAALPAGRGVIAEGAALLPDCVAPLALTQAVWLVPSPSFQRQHYARRVWVKDVLRGCTDPERAFENWMERDARFARLVSRRARQLGAHCITVDGSQGLEEIIARVWRAFRA